MRYGTFLSMLRAITLARSESFALLSTDARGVVARESGASTSRSLLGVRGGGEERDEDEEDEEEIFVDTSVEARPCVELPDDVARCSVGLVVVDAFSPFHGRWFAARAREVYGAGIVQTLSGYMAQGLLFASSDLDEEAAVRAAAGRAPEPGREAEWASRVPFRLLGVYCESDSGLATAERLGAALRLPRHDGDVNRGRRDKFATHVQARACGLRTPEQRLCATTEEASEFARTVAGIGRDDDARCVVKPARGVASDGVVSCRDVAEVAAAFRAVRDSPVFGSGGTRVCGAALVQEFARGTEHAVDLVSRDGEHKVAAVWRYDKRPVNGAPFVYHATRLVDDEAAAAAARFAAAALDAVRVRWGTSHVEVIVDDETSLPTLVEINCRQHNTDFAPLTTLCVGHNALDMLLAAYLGDVCAPLVPEEALNWYSLPDFPALRVAGAIVHLVSRVEGTLKEVRHLDQLEALESVRRCEIYNKPGETIEKTIDIRTDAGWLHLAHDDPKQLERDYNTIVEEIMPDMFVVE